MMQHTATRRRESEDSCTRRKHRANLEEAPPRSHEGPRGAMLLDKPPWVVHKGEKLSTLAQLFGLDISSDGTRFATAGGDNKVKIWALRPVLHADAEADASLPRVLATLEDHYAPVNTCRFSPSGRRLATGSDDKLVLVHELRPGPAKVAFGAVGGPAVENWKLVLNLRGHGNNVTDVTWSPDGLMLASASLDNTVCIWDASGSLLRTLTGHESFVKGVAWDPVGTYLASQSDDHSVIVWRCEDWTPVARLTEPYKRSKGSTYSLRLCWSPDGQSVTTTNGYDHNNPTAPVLMRGEWTGASIQICGHQAPVVVVRYNPRLFHRPEGDDKHSSKTCAVFAMGSQDKQVTVWRTSRALPLILLKKFCDNAVIDMCWTPDGYSLLCCSLDGTVASFTFDQQELGKALTVNEHQAALEKLYGDASQRKGTTLIEDPALLALQARAAAKPPSAPQQMQPMRRLVATPVAAPTLPPAPANAHSQPPTLPSAPLASPQREFRGADGRRRIVPQAVGGQPPSAGVSPLQASRPPTALAQPAVSPAFPGAGGASQPAGGSFAFASAGATASRPPTALPVPVLPPPPQPGASQPARRVVPQPVGPTPAAAAPVPGAGPTPPARAPMGNGNGVLAAKRKADAMGPSAPRAGPSNAIVPVPPLASAAPARLLVPAPSQQAALVAVLVPGGTSDSDGTLQPAVLLEARNTDAACNLACTRGGEIMWRDVLPGAALALSGSSTFAAVSTTEGCLTIYSPAGRRALPPIALGGPAAFMAASASKLLVASSGSGTLWLWDVHATAGEATCVVTDSIATLLASAPPGVGVTGLRFSSNMHPLVVLSNGHVYLLSPTLKAWARVADGTHLRSDFWSIAGSGGGDVTQLQASAARGVVQTAGGPGALVLASVAGGGGSARAETGRHLEFMLNGALALRSASEVQRWLPIYACHLAKDNQLTRLRELLTDLLGPVHWREPPSLTADARGPGGWLPRLVGLSKRELLQTHVLPALAASRVAQRVVAEFADLANTLDGDAAAA